MSTRLQYRTKLKDKVLGLENEGYGDFEYTDSEYNTFLELAVARLYPALHKVVGAGPYPLTLYGSSNYMASVVANFPERIFLVEDAAERTPVYGWTVRSGQLSNIDVYQGISSNGKISSVYYYYHDAYELPADDTTDAGIPAAWTPLVVLGALIEALEARHDTGVRPDKSEGHQEVSLLDRLVARYERHKDELAMSLPPVMV